MTRLSKWSALSRNVRQLDVLVTAFLVILSLVLWGDA